jgi:hypothetical protein
MTPKQQFDKAKSGFVQMKQKQSLLERLKSILIVFPLHFSQARGGSRLSSVSEGSRFCRRACDATINQIRRGKYQSLQSIRPGSNENLDPPLSAHVLAMQAKLLTKNLKEPALLKICLKRPCMAKHGGSRTCMADPWRRRHVMLAAPGVGHAISKFSPCTIAVHP